MSLNDELSTLFANLSALMELRGDNVFKVIAFQKVGRIIRELNIDLKKCMEEGKLCDIEGIGKGSQQIIEEYITSGKSSVYAEVSAAIPPGLVPMLHIEGLGPKTINLLWKERGVTSLDELTKAIDTGQLKSIKGMGEKKIASIKHGIEQYKSRVATDGTAMRRTGIADAAEQAEPLLEAVRKIPGVKRAEIAGSLRRRKETIGDVDLIAAVDHMDAGGPVISAFVKLPGVVQTLGAGESKASVKVANGMQVDLRVVPDENFGAALMYFTGSKEHNVKIRGLAQKQKMTLNEWGLYKIDEYDKAKKETAKPPMIASEEPDIAQKSLSTKTNSADQFNPRLRRLPSAHTVEGSLPVLFFGDLLTAKVATVGLNPSLWEYLDEKTRKELDGDVRRFETLKSLHAPSRDRLTDTQCARAVDAMRSYFARNATVYQRWFGGLTRVINGFGASYADGTGVHLDLVQEATDPPWSELKKLFPEELKRLRRDDLPFLRWQLERFPLSVVLCNGQTALTDVTNLLNSKLVDQGSLKLIEWSISIANVQGREVVIAGWNIPLARPTGLGNDGEQVLGKLIKDKIEEGRAHIKTPTRTHRNAKALPPVAARTEEEIYRALGLSFIDPEIREDFGEVDLAKKNALPKLITRADIRGDLHTHTNASDGKNSIEEMAHAAQELGYEYLAITDHSKALAMANGLSVERLIKHIENIHKISDKLKGITLLAGSEVDILVDGRMDYDDDVLKLLDIVIASPHVSLKQDTEKATTRLLRAIDNKYVNIIGHPTGRLINGRDGLPLQMDKLFSAAAANGTALEINAGYPRLDLNDINARNAIAAGCMLAIDTDTHTTIFEEITWGLGVARRAGATAKNVINCMKLPELKKFLAAKRDR